MTTQPFIERRSWTDSRTGVEYLILDPVRRDDWQGRLPEVYVPVGAPVELRSVGDASATADDLRAYAEAILAALDERSTATQAGDPA